MRKKYNMTNDVQYKEFLFQKKDAILSLLPAEARQQLAQIELSLASLDEFYINKRKNTNKVILQKVKTRKKNGKSYREFVTDTLEKLGPDFVFADVKNKMRELFPKNPLTETNISGVLYTLKKSGMLKMKRDKKSKVVTYTKVA